MHFWPTNQLTFTHATSEGLGWRLIRMWREKKLRALWENWWREKKGWWLERRSWSGRRAQEATKSSGSSYTNFDSIVRKLKELTDFDFDKVIWGSMDFPSKSGWKCMVFWCFHKKTFAPNSNFQRPYVKRPKVTLMFVDTHFRNTFRKSPIQPSSISLWTRFMYYILFILLSMAQAHATYGGNWGSVIWRVWVGSFRTFCMSLAHACYQVGKGRW